MTVTEKILASLSLKELEKLELFVLQEKEKRRKGRVLIDDLEMSVRLKNSLKRADFDTLNELTDFTKNELRNLNGMGWKSISELEDLMSTFNLSLKK